MGGDPICSKICQTELQLSANASDEEHQSMAGNLVNFFKCSEVDWCPGLPGQDIQLVLQWLRQKQGLT